MDSKPNQGKGENKGWANLRPCKKGEVRNPNGRTPKIQYASEITREYLNAKKIDVTVSGMTANGMKIKHILLDASVSMDHILTATLIQSGINGDIPAIKELRDRAYGKPKESIDLTSGGDKLEAPIIQVVSDAAAASLKKITEGINTEPAQ